MHQDLSNLGARRAEYALRSYLALIAGGAPSSHFLEIRFRVREQQLASEFHAAHEYEALADAIRRRGSRTADTTWPRRAGGVRSRARAVLSPR
jgi:hypothetical protein